MTSVLNADAAASRWMSGRGSAAPGPVVLGRVPTRRFMMEAPRVTVIVPCFNEADRLDLARFDELPSARIWSLLFVDDGSTDSTAALIRAWASDHSNVALLDLPSNVGKGEAIRAGLLQALDGGGGAGADIVAYLDADLASPPSELLRVLDVVLDDSRIELAMGSRVALLGSNIERSRLRHYQGRIFATVASLVLGLSVYDTQCGLKVDPLHVGASRCARDAVSVTLGVRCRTDRPHDGRADPAACRPDPRGSAARVARRRRFTAVGVGPVCGRRTTW